MALEMEKPRSMKQLPAKLGKKIKRQFRRFTSFHHVTPAKQQSVGDAFPIITSISTSPLLFHPITPTRPSSYRRDRKVKEIHPTSFQESLAYSAELSQSSKSSVDMQEDHSLSHEATASTSAREDTEPESVVDESSRPTHLAEESGQVEAEQSHPSAANEETALSSPPTVYVEPDVPNPFLIDDDEASFMEDDSAPPASQSQSTITPQDVSLTLPTEPATPHSIGLPSANLNKAVPPPPASDSETDEDDAPDLYLPGLIIPTMFLPIPNTDPLSTLLTKYIYPPENRPVRDITGDWQRSDFHTLVMTNSWRALARMARDRLVTTDPEDLTLILGLWYLRLACLARLRLFNQTSAECTNLFAVLNAIDPPEARTWVFDRVLPFELEVMHARLKYWAGDHMSHLDALNALLRKCRTKARQEKANATAVSLWKERGARVCLIIASQLVEMKDFRAATKLLEPLCTQGDGTSTAELRSSIGRIYLQSGDIETAAKHFEAVAADPAASQELKDMNAGLLASAEGHWVRAASLLETLIAKDANNFVAVNNLSVALLSQGKLREGIDVLETALKASPSSVVVAEPFLFNLSTLYELRSSTAAENKRNLLLEVAKWSGDGLRTTCLKMPTN
ncbi:hypothetical protein D9615_003662 [Tricholomella constricta]|uniref:Trafficking protein particle complex subunit 12 n=1 Tax=Tricholomella constricta TaxID=117010 RepID=A0A8H5HHZ3_9AGAR|nr:hypothetical protein D9615_003662 [Tricholomella constricta]